MHRWPILLAAIFFFCLGSRAYSEDGPVLPSRQADVVLPLLRAFHPGDGYSHIEHILGKEDIDTGDAIKDCIYGLSDGSSIRVRSDGKKVFSIFWQRPGIHVIQVIFAADKTWQH